MPANPVTEATLYNMQSGVVRYPDPFFDLAKNYIPKNIKTLFGFCKNLFYTSSYLRNVINKMTQYPITDVLYASDIEEKTRNTYDKILHDHLKIKSFLIGVGMDYYTYGNSIITAYSIPKRFLVCNKCKETSSFETTTFRFINFKFEGQCKSCKSNTTFTIEDSKIKSISNFKLVRLNPENVDVEYNHLTGDSEYNYNIPNKVKRKIQIGDKQTLASVPLAFIEATKKRKAVKLDPKNLYHLKYPSLSEEDMGWAKPPILPALKEIFYLQTLRRGNEAIIHEHLVPKKSIFPAANGSLDPFSKMNMGTWRSQMQSQLKRWKIDPNHIAIFPIPIGYQELGGNAKMLMLTPEMKFLEESIINSLGVPLEFIKGGTTWTGSSVSLRIVENGFLNYREHLRDLMNYFILPKVSEYLSIPSTKIYFKKFKMNDDSEFKQLLIQLYQAKGISMTRLHEEMGINTDEETRAMDISDKRELDTFLNQQRTQAIAVGESQLIGARYQGQAQEELNNQAIKNKIRLFEEELLVELENPNDDLFDVIEKITLSIKNLPDVIRNQQLLNMAKVTPITFGLVQERLGFYMAQEMQMMYGGMPQASVPEGGGEKAPNQKELGERKSDQVEIKGEKHKGPTKGEA
jgi:hypothetical protein